MWQALVGGATNLISGLLGQNAQENANAAGQANWQTQMNYQHEANTKSVQWRVADAIAAGIHPLAALGMNPASGSGVSLFTPQAENGMAQGLAGMGQDISRAIMANKSQQEKDAAYSEAAKAADIENRDLKNQLLRLQLRRAANEDQPSVPKPQENLMPAPGDTSHTEGSQPSVSWYEPTPGVYRPSPSKTYKESIEDDWIRQGIASYEQLIAPLHSPSYNRPPSHVPLKPGHHWVYSSRHLGYVQRPNRKSSDRPRFDYGSSSWHGAP